MSQNNLLFCDTYYRIDKNGRSRKRLHNLAVVTYGWSSRKFCNEICGGCGRTELVNWFRSQCFLVNIFFSDINIFCTLDERAFKLNICNMITIIVRPLTSWLMIYGTSVWESSRSSDAVTPFCSILCNCMWYFMKCVWLYSIHLKVYSCV